jgi:peptidoglycan/xylan/chitin deacetylase (PgdA/CDA1 family)
VDNPHLIEARIRALESPEYRGTAARRRAQRHQQKTTGFQGARIPIDGVQRIAQAAQHFVEDDDIKLLGGRVVLTVRREESTAFGLLLLRHGDGAGGYVDSDIPRIGRARESSQQNPLAASDIQHCPTRLQVRYVARQYAEARELGKLPEKIPPARRVLRLPGLRGLQQAIGPAAAIEEQLQPARCVIQKRMRANAWAVHGVRSILWIMSALPILCYHNVAKAPKEARFKLLYVSPESFERQLWTLHRIGLRGVSTTEGIARLHNGTARGCVVLTFDDGYADTLTTAAPLIKRYGFSATCYVVSGAVGTYNRWDAEYLQETKSLMSREQIDEWLAAGMEVGSHSCSHARLKELPRDTAQYEIAESRAALRKMFGIPVEHFAYPFGHFTAESVELVRLAGYVSAVTVLPGLTRASDDQLRLPRMLVNGERGLWKFLLQVAAPYQRLWPR